MNKMLVAVFDTEPAAYEGLNALKELHADGDISLYTTAVLVKDSSGAVSVKQSADQGPLGTAVGMLTGSVTGLLAGEAGAAAGLALGGLAGPLGAAIGLSLGGLTGLIVDLSESGVNVDFVDEVSKALIPGKAAVVAEVEETWQTPVDTRLGKLGGLVFRRLRSEVVEDQLVSGKGVSGGEGNIDLPCLQDSQDCRHGQDLDEGEAPAATRGFGTQWFQPQNE